MDNLNLLIGQRLRLFRQEQKLSLDKVSGLTGVSKAMLGQIERAESVPTVATLWKIATGLRIPFSAFMPPEPVADHRQDPQPISDSNHTRSTIHGPDEPPHPASTAAEVKILLPYEPIRNQELLLVSLPAMFSYETSAHAPGLIEHVFPLQDSVEIWCDSAWHTVKAGERFTFKADQKHGYRNSGNKEVQFHNLICYQTAPETFQP